MSTFILNHHTFHPSNIICIGRNYVEHIHELGNDVPDDMVVFNKPASCVRDILLSEQGEPLHYECELCLLIRGGRIAGVGLGLDLTKRELQSQLKTKGLPWERAKAFDGAATFSPFIDTPADLNRLRFTLHIDEVLVQEGSPSLMMYPPEVILAELSRFMTPNDDDIIMTGTPKGVGVVTAGSRFTARLYDDDQCRIEHTWVAQ
ncbi:fumarylacetoacetate hydrolase family protein [Reinekea blandensis]|uniref:Fumarylacetoacetate hydrolase family protein n=1 Tax=Reinekea blandensis MED297 TaxID=314283 RepID=A4BJ65_9GAMM|nr:fumarylacetoacetate hydrolase family protein [Reinekea blandensis]EAR07818.1 fumarylacetoacetate hydrolase family protein [Reinekea sp. MED297] [Reinekea blandensis MED297]